MLDNSPPYYIQTLLYILVKNVLGNVFFTFIDDNFSRWKSVKCVVHNIIKQIKTTYNILTLFSTFIGIIQKWSTKKSKAASRVKYEVPYYEVSDKRRMSVVESIVNLTLLRCQFILKVYAVRLHYQILWYILLKK